MTSLLKISILYVVLYGFSDNIENSCILPAYLEHACAMSFKNEQQFNNISYLLQFIAFFVHTHNREYLPVQVLQVQRLSTYLEV